MPLDMEKMLEGAPEPDEAVDDDRLDGEVEEEDENAAEGDAPEADETSVSAEPPLTPSELRKLLKDVVKEPEAAKETQQQTPQILYNFGLQQNEAGQKMMEALNAEDPVTRTNTFFTLLNRMLSDVHVNVLADAKKMLETEKENFASTATSAARVQAAADAFFREFPRLKEPQFGKFLPTIYKEVHEKNPNADIATKYRKVGEIAMKTFNLSAERGQKKPTTMTNGGKSEKPAGKRSAEEEAAALFADDPRLKRKG